MTRSFGDMIVKPVGVNAEPEIVEWRIENPQTSYLVMASDGIWEFVSTEKACEVLCASLERGESTEKALCDLCEFSRLQWDEMEDGEYVDDITAILVPLNLPVAPRLSGDKTGC